MGSRLLACGFGGTWRSTSDEFCRRYKAWQAMHSEEMVDLRQFFQKSNGTNDNKWPDWENTTWKTLRDILVEAKIKIGELNDKNELWAVLKMSHVVCDASNAKVTVSKPGRLKALMEMTQYLLPAV
jgi:hypothetical protein